MNIEREKDERPTSNPAYGGTFGEHRILNEGQHKMLWLARTRWIQDVVVREFKKRMVVLFFLFDVGRSMFDVRCSSFLTFCVFAPSPVSLLREEKA